MSARHLFVLPLALVLTACGGKAPSSTTPAGSTHAPGTTDSLRQLIIADSLRDGYHAYRDASGRITMEGTMRDGRRHGLWTSYFPNTRVKSRTEYAEGEAHGITTVFHDNGVLFFTGANRRGKPAGEWRFFDRQGTLAKTAVYDTTGAVINTR